MKHTSTWYLYLLPLLLSIFVLSASFTVFNEAATTTSVNQIEWLSLEEAIKKNQHAPRKILVNVSTAWCLPCKQMMHTTFQETALVSYINDKYYAVKFDAETKEALELNGETFHFNPNIGSNGVHNWALFLANGKTVYPTIAILDEGFNNPQAVFGFQDASNLNLVLNYFGEDYHEKMAWDIYTMTFQTKE